MDVNKKPPRKYFKENWFIVNWINLTYNFFFFKKENFENAGLIEINEEGMDIR